MLCFPLFFAKKNVSLLRDILVVVIKTAQLLATASNIKFIIAELYFL